MPGQKTEKKFWESVKENLASLYERIEKNTPAFLKIEDPTKWNVQEQKQGGSTAADDGTRYAAEALAKAIKGKSDSWQKQKSVVRLQMLQDTFSQISSITNSSLSLKIDSLSQKRANHERNIDLQEKFHKMAIAATPAQTKANEALTAVNNAKTAADTAAAAPTSTNANAAKTAADNALTTIQSAAQNIAKYLPQLTAEATKAYAAVSAAQTAATTAAATANQTNANATKAAAATAQQKVQATKNAVDTFMSNAPLNYGKALNDYNNKLGSLQESTVSAMEAQLGVTATFSTLAAIAGLWKDLRAFKAADKAPNPAQLTYLTNLAMQADKNQVKYDDVAKAYNNIIENEKKIVNTGNSGVRRNTGEDEDEKAQPLLQVPVIEDSKKDREK